MILVVIRHGESEADILDVIEGRANFNLTERGKKQAHAMANYITQTYRIDKIYASPLKRANQTANILNEKTKCSITLVDDLMEFNNGLLAGLKRDVAAKLYPKNETLAFDQAMYGMESLKDFRLRADSVLNQIISENSDQQVIAIVSHGGLINRLYQSFLNMPIQTNVSFPTGDTGIHIWEIKNGVRNICVTNSLFHIKEIA